MGVLKEYTQVTIDLAMIEGQTHPCPTPPYLTADEG